MMSFVSSGFARPPGIPVPIAFPGSLFLSTEAKMAGEHSGTRLNDGPPVIGANAAESMSSRLRAFSFAAVVRSIFMYGITGGLSSAALFCLICAPAIQAEEDATIVVTGDKRPRPISESITRTEVVDRDQIERQGSRNLSDILRSQPGIEVREGIRGQEIRMQGLDPEYVLILVDGNRITGRIDGAIDLSRIKAEEIERIEIIKGPASALYGSEAMAGVINIITRRSRSPFFAQAEIQYGSGREIHFGSGNETHASAAVGTSSETFSNMFIAGWHRSDGFDLNPETEQKKRARVLGRFLPGFEDESIPSTEDQTGSAFRDLNVSDRFSYSIQENWEVDGSLSYRYLDQEIVDFSPPRAVLDRRNETHDAQAGISTRYEWSYPTALSLHYSHARFLDTLTIDQRRADDLDSEETQEDRTHEFRTQFDYGLDRHVLSVGLEGLIEEYVSPRIEGSGYGYRQRTAGFVQDEWQPLDEFLYITPGVRFEHDSQFGSQALPRLSARWDPAEKWTVRVGAGQGYRAPSFKDLYFAFQNPGVGYQVVGNPDLEPEKSNGYNASVDYAATKWLWLSVSGFYNSITNLIDFRRLPERSNDLTTYQTVNISKAFTRGLETMAEFRFMERWVAGLGYTFTDTYDRFQEIPLEGRARHRGFYSLSYSPETGFGFSIRGNIEGNQPFYYEKDALLTFQNNRFELDSSVVLPAVYQKRDFQLIDLDPDTPDYGYYLANANHTLDIRIRYRFLEYYEAFAGVDNVFDHYDAELDPRRPRFIYFGIRMTVETAPARPLPSEPDSVERNEIELIESE